VLVKADYSQLELRIAAKVSGDAALLAAFRRGDDLHETTARAVLGVEEVTPEQRQLAKAINFGLLFGMSARGFQSYARKNYGVALSDREAADYRERFFRAYPGLAAWHGRTRQRRAKETRTLTGRRRLLTSTDGDTLRLNSPIQGTGADIIKSALALLWERRDQCPGAFPVLAVHDEIVVQADADKADAAVGWLKAAMTDAAASDLDPVPVGPVDPVVCRTWAGDIPGESAAVPGSV
jgi:DNA polymerase-1